MNLNGFRRPTDDLPMTYPCAHSDDLGHREFISIIHTDDPFSANIPMTSDDLPMTSDDLTDDPPTPKGVYSGPLGAAGIYPLGMVAGFNQQAG